MGLGNSTVSLSLQLPLRGAVSIRSRAESTVGRRNIKRLWLDWLDRVSAAANVTPRVWRVRLMDTAKGGGQERVRASTVGA
jgi:hypothetical protein